MKKTLIALLAASTLLGSAPLAMAQGAPAQQNCQGKDCQKSQQQKGQPSQQGQAHSQNGQKTGHQSGQKTGQQAGHQQQAQEKSQHKAPQRGDSARNAQRPNSAQLKKLPSPPKGQEYRILNDRVVRVDSNTLAVVAVAGLVATLLAN